MPGVRVNLTKKGVSSVSVGKNGARVNVGKKGTRTTVGLPGTGLSYSSYSPRNKQIQKTSLSSNKYSNDSGVILKLFKFLLFLLFFAIFIYLVF